MPVLLDNNPPPYIVLTSNRADHSGIKDEPEKRATAMQQQCLTPPSTTPTKGKRHRHSNSKRKETYVDKSAYTVESLTTEVEAAQQEIRDANMQYREVERELLATELKLQDDSNELRAQRKKDDVSRSQLRSEMKALEEQKVNIELQRAKVDKQLQGLSQTLKRMEAEESKWTNTSQIIERKTEDLSSTDTESYLENANKKMAEMESLQHSLLAVEDEVKSVTSEIRSLDSMKKSLAERSTSRGEDSHSNSQEILKILEHTKDSKAEILRQQIHFDTDLDQKWRDVQRQLEQRYVQVYGEYGEATRLLESAKIQYQQRQVIYQPDSASGRDDIFSTTPSGHSEVPSATSITRDIPASFGHSNSIEDFARRPSTFEGDENFSTAVQMFLPSNLFGADDLNDSLTQSSFEAIDELPIRSPAYPSQTQTSSPSSSFDAFRVSSDDTNSPYYVNKYNSEQDYELDTTSPLPRPNTQRRLSGMFGFGRGKQEAHSDPASSSKGSLFFRNKRKQGAAGGKGTSHISPHASFTSDEHTLLSSADKLTPAFDPFQASWNRSDSPGGQRNIFGPVNFGSTSEWSTGLKNDQHQEWKTDSYVPSIDFQPQPFRGFLEGHHGNAEVVQGDDSHGVSEETKDADDATGGASSTYSDFSVLTDASKDSNGKESIIQKGIRTLTSPRKGSSSSAKFNVGKLSFFGGKKYERSDASSAEAEFDDVVEPTLGAIHETRSGSGSPHLNMEEFLKQT